MRRGIALALGALLASAAGLAGGCGGEPAPGPGDTAVVLGSTDRGGDGFAPMAGDVALVPGAQGGFHVWLKYRVSGMAGSMRVRHSAERTSDGRPVLVGLSRRVEIGTPGPDGSWQVPTAAPAFMCPAPLGTRVHDERIRFTVELLDGDDHPIAAGRAEATPRCPDGAEAALCAKICDG